MQNLLSINKKRDLIKSQDNPTMTDPRQRAWIEVDSAAIETNTSILKGLIAENCLFMAVVKADGYGHGATNVAHAALRGGAQYLGIATLQEGLELRESGLTCPVLVLGNLTKAEELKICLEWNLTPTISSIKEAIICEEIAEKSKLRYPIHLKVDTGMTRLGCDLDEALNLINQIDDLKHVILKGVYSHLALADQKSSTATYKQKKKFDSLIRSLKIQNKSFCYHIANSAATLIDDTLHYDMVRVGLAIYGYSPIKDLQNHLNLKPALTVKARVTLIRKVPNGVGVSYGHSFITKRTSRLAVVAIGYADGINRALSGKISPLINGRSIPQVGAITMDQLVMDVTDHPEVQVGNVVTLLGADGNNCITPQQWCHLSGSIPWEVLCGFKDRLPRIVI